MNSSSDSSFHSELEWLREQKRNIELTLDDVNHRIGEVEDKDSNSSSDQH